MGLSRVGYPLLVVIFVVTFLSFCAMIGGFLVQRSEQRRLRRGAQVEQAGAKTLSIATRVFMISFLILLLAICALTIAFWG